ncbi:cell death protein 3-like [Mytilus trossulus]|uniref:cell death protein 3-like n=1 Tax=Mytilus trossulus TaxID=6551 RepID=UPI00300425CB
MATNTYEGTVKGRTKSKEEMRHIFESILKSGSLKSKRSVSSNQNEYECNNIYRGLAIIISNENFKNCKQRNYCDDELTNMQETFGQHLNFTVVTFKDLTAQQINWVVEIACEQTQFHQNSDCFACIIGSHGNEKPRPVDSLPTEVYYRDHCIYGVDNDTVTTKSIIEKVAGVKGLQDKPKMFFIQACRSKMKPDEFCNEHGHEVLVRSIVKNSLNQTNEATSSDTVSPSASKPTDNDPIGSMSKDQDITEFSIKAALKKFFDYNINKPKEIIRVVDPPCADDCLVVYSTASEKNSYGREGVGGWMLYSLHKAILTQIKRIDQESSKINCIDILRVLNDMTYYVSKYFEVDESSESTHPKGMEKRKVPVVFEHCFPKEMCFYL